MGISTDTRIRLFVDDCLLYRRVTTTEDTNILQKDLDKIHDWSKEWQMEFNTQKCSILRVRKARSKGITKEYTMNNAKLQDNLTHHPYLGVELSSDMSWNHHIDKATTKATQKLNLLRRTVNKGASKETREAAYQALVRPHLEYACAVWDPYLSKHIDQVERVQRKAARYVSNNYDRNSSTSEIIQQMGWPSLLERRFIQRHSLMYKIVNKEIGLPVPTYIEKPSRSSKNHHEHHMMPIRCNNNIYKYSFFPRTIKTWNILPPALVYSNSAEIFKDGLWNMVKKGVVMLVKPQSLQYLSGSRVLLDTTLEPGAGTCAPARPLF
jgi:hypothetical protein